MNKATGLSQKVLLAVTASVFIPSTDLQNSDMGRVFTWPYI